MEDKAMQLIMLIDDDSAIIKLVEGMLRRKGWCAFITTSQPETAIEYLSDKSNVLPVLIITDNEMGKICGEDIIKLAQSKKIPVVLMSGRPDIAQPIAEQCDVKFLSKPFGFEELCNAVNNVLGLTS